MSAGVPVQRIVPLIEQTASVSNGQSSSAVAADSSNGKLSSLGPSSDKKRDTDKAEKPISKLRKTDNIIISINHQNALVSESSEPPFSLDLLSDVTRPLKPQVQNDNLQHTSLIPQFSLTQEQMLGQSLKWGQSLMNLQSKLHGLPSVPASGVMMSNTQDTTGNMSLTPLPQDAQRTPKVQMFPTAPQSVKTTRQGLSAFPNELPLLLGSLQPPNPRATRFLLNPANIAYMLGNAHMMQMPNSAVGKQSQVSDVKNPTDLANAAVLQQTPSPQKQQPQLANGQTAKIQLDPSQTTGCGSGRTPLLLYSKLDDTALSAYQCLVRQQIEMFEATQDDVQFNISKMSKAIVHGQVGIRCRHCAILPQYSRPKAAVYYPRTLDSLYQFGQNMVKNHLCMTCKSIPEETKKTLVMLQEERRRGKGGRERWAKAAQERGAFEDKDGLRFG